MSDHTITYVGSGAGSGKTYRLVSIIAEQLNREDISPEQIYAMTFTKKAAEEIRDRVKQRFVVGNESMQPNFEKAAQTSRINIGTIDSICENLIRMFAIEGGISPKAQVLESDQSQILLKEVCGNCIPNFIVERLDEIETHFCKEKSFFVKVKLWQDYLMDILNEIREYQIKGFDNNTEDNSVVDDMALRNANELIEIISGGKEIPDSRAIFVEQAEEINEKISQYMESDDKKKRSWGIIQNKFNELQRKLQNDSSLWVTEWKELPNNCKSSVDSINDSGIPKQIELLSRLFLQDAKYHEEIREYYTLLFRAAKIVSDAFLQRKDELGLIDFTDQEVKLYELLNREDIITALSPRMKVLIIDEFQDTNPIQLALFMRMASLPGIKVYWIGDIKQSIYGFRGSDVELMKSIISNDDVYVDESLRNDTSYRSHKGLVELANTLFLPTFEKDNLNEKDVVLKVPDNSETTHPIPQNYFRRWTICGKKSETATQLANAISSLMTENAMVCDKQTKKQRPLRWGDIAVLCSKNDRCAEIQTALRCCGVPVVATGAGLLETPEAILLRSCLAFIREPQDTLARAEIITLAESSSPEQWLPKRIAEYEGNSSFGDETNEMLRTLAEIRKQANNISPLEIIDIVLYQTNIERIVIGWSKNKQRAQVRLANIAAFRELAKTFLTSNSGRNLGDFLAYLDQSAQKKSDSLGTTNADAVTVCTWHSSKGLEWPFVVLCDADEDVKNRIYDTVFIYNTSDTPVDIHDPLKNRAIRLWIKLWTGENLAYDVVNAVPSESVLGGVRDALYAKTDSDNRRLLYVTVTRARDYLVNVFTVKSTGSTDPSESRYWHALAPEVISVFENEKGAVPINSDSTPTGIQNSTLYWLPTAAPRKEREPLRILPSNVENTSVTATLFCSYPNQLARLKESDTIREHGTDYHNAIAYYCSNDKENPFAGTHWTADVQKSVKAFITCVDEKFPGATVFTEVPVHAEAEEGRWFDARIDMVIETADGYYIVDHKLTERKPDDLIKFACSYSGELLNYKRALEKVGTKKVLGLLLHLPEDGILLDVK